MQIKVCAALVSTLSPHFDLSKSRLMTLAFLIVGIAEARTVNLSHIACTLPGEAAIASRYRRLQRFFQHVRLDQEIVARLVVRLLDLSRPKCLALDRTNWKVGCSDINILVLAIVTRRFRVPLLWTVLDHRGNSGTAQRIALMERYLALFDARSIELLLADREFIGADWINFLNENNIPFAIRLKSDLLLTDPAGRTLPFASWLRRARARTKPVILSGTQAGVDATLAIADKQLRTGELLIVATNTRQPRKALSCYARRWAVECLFGNAKTRGFNMEDTRLVNPGKTSTLMAVLTLAIAWAYRCATTVMAMKAIKRKPHGRRHKSWFRIGFDALRNWLANNPQKAITAWRRNWPKRKMTNRVVHCVPSQPIENFVI